MAEVKKRANWLDRLVRPQPRSVEKRAGFGGYPRSESEWQDRYSTLRDMYHLEPYTESEIDGLHLFRAEDDSGDDLARTRRLVRDFAFVIDKNADHLFVGGITVDPAQADDDANEDAARDAEQGAAILSRSKIGRRLSMLAHNLAMGRGGIEVRLDPREEGEFAYKARLVPHAPETYSVTTDDATGLEIERVVIRSTYYDADDTSGSGDVMGDARLHTYVRTLTRDEVVVELDGERVEEESGPHGLGVVPFVNLVPRPTREAEHGVSAAHGLEQALALIDSLYTQAHATGARFADPLLTGKNVNLSGSSVGRFGRSLYWEERPNVSTEVKYVEPSMAGVSGILKAIDSLHKTARGTMPEFGLFDASSAASGEALKTLQQAFVAKVYRSRANVLPGLAEAVQMAVHLERNEAHNADAEMFRVTTGPVIPGDTAAEMAVVLDAKGEGLISTPDSIRHLQRLGIVPAHHDPEEYAIKVQEETSGGPVEFLRPAPGEKPEDPAPMDADHAADMEDAAQELRDVLEALGTDEADLDAIAEGIREALGLLAPESE